jgi:acyl dehydratase
MVSRSPLRPAPQPAARVRFTADDVDMFAQASHDFNPLHLSDIHARKTPYGERVVFGIPALDQKVREITHGS